MAITAIAIMAGVRTITAIIARTIAAMAITRGTTATTAAGPTDITAAAVPA